MMAPAARRSQRDPGNAQIIARRFTPHSRCLLDSTQGPPKPSQRDHLFASLFAQDISHPTEANGPRRKLCLDLFAMAGFQVTLYGRFWGTAKDRFRLSGSPFYRHTSSMPRDARFRENPNLAARAG